MLHFLLEQLDVSREYCLCRNEILDSAIFCVRTQLQVSPRLLGNAMSLTQSFLCRSEKLVVGLLLLLSCKYSGEASISLICSSSKSDFRRRSGNALSRIIGRRHARSVEEYRCDLCIVHFSEIVGLITCKSVWFSHLAKRRSVSWIVAMVISM